ncbi:MAG: carboxymethylenebutenolidase [Terriglobia bacterium]|nr:MAG: carboxymethylenebutenolidase [Terriglobia bacterium]
MYRRILCLIGIASWTALAQAPRPAGRGGGLSGKDPALPANLFTSSSTLAHTSLRHEWVDIPMGSGKLHTWIEYPSGEAKAPLVLLMHYDAGLDDLQRAVADQLATDGFIAIAPDLLSGLGSKAGNYDSFPYPDEALRTLARMKPDEALQRFKIAFDYGMKLPRANGKGASLGCGIGGTNSFRFAAEAPNLSAAVVFYGMPPDPAEMAKVHAPVLGLYGADDPAVVATIEPTAALMKKLGKSYQYHIYPGATHFFMSYQVEGRNGEAVAEAWPAATAFLKQALK